MIKKLDITQVPTVKEIIDLQLASYRIEADLIGFHIPPLDDTIESLMNCGEIFYGYFTSHLVGMISYKMIDGTLDIHRLAVHPDFFKKGIASQLFDFLEFENAKKMIVCTGTKNIPAVDFYKKKGFCEVRQIEVASGIYITEFVKG